MNDHRLQNVSFCRGRFFLFQDEKKNSLSSQALSFEILKKSSVLDGNPAAFSVSKIQAPFHHACLKSGGGICSGSYEQ